MELIQTAGKDVILICLMYWTIWTGRKTIEATVMIFEPIKEGIQLVFNKLRTTLQQKD